MLTNLYAAMRLFAVFLLDGLAITISRTFRGQDASALQYWTSNYELQDFFNCVVLLLDSDAVLGTCAYCQ